MKPISNYISEKLFTDIDSQMNEMDEVLIKKELIRISKTDYPENIIIDNKNISVLKQTIFRLDLSDRNVDEFIKSIYKAGYRFNNFDCILEVNIVSGDQIDFLNNITVSGLHLIIKKNISIKNDWNISFNERRLFNVENFDKITSLKNINIKCGSIGTSILLSSSENATDIDKFDEFLQKIKPNKKLTSIKLYSIDLSNQNSNDYEKIMIDIINNCKFIKNRFLCVEYYEFNILNNEKKIQSMFCIVKGKPGTDTFTLKNLYN